MERDWNIKHIPRICKNRKFPETLSFQDVKKLLEVTLNLKHKASVAYSAGLRVSEVSNLKITDIDSKSMRIFIRQGKGKKDRYEQLAQKFSKWNGIFYDEKLTSAIIDRLVHHSHLLVFDGPSYKLTHSTTNSH